KLRLLPGFNPTYPTVVITGVPNAGKSSFIKSNTSGKPEVASYPFTTKSVIFGHRQFKFFNIQFVDTPGLLDRSFMDRNDIELQALLALKYLSDILVFFYDPTGGGNSSDEDQMNLLREIAEFYPAMIMIGAVTKNDIVPAERIQEIMEKMKETQIFEEGLIFSINNLSTDDSSNLLSKIEDLILNRLLKSPKFRSVGALEVDPEFIPEEEDPDWGEF
ncbi:MAG: GTPase, partial [Candidatus Kariarchaeaceae archaeon]